MYIIKKLIKILLYFSPQFFKDIVYKYHETNRIKIAKKNKKVVVHKKDLEEIFNSIHFDKDVFFHTSIMDIGKIEGGYIEVVKLINKHIYEKNNTILFSALPFKGSSELYLKNLKQFNSNTAPVMTGIINEYYSLKSNSRRSLSPTHSVIALGKDADYYVNEHHLSVTSFTEKSPYFKLIEKNAKILMFGATMNHLTFYHVIEDLLGDLFPFNDIYTKEFIINITNGDNLSETRPFKAHKGYRSLFKDFRMNNELKKLNSTIVYKLGLSEFILLDAKDIILFLLKSLSDGKSLYGKVKVSLECRNRTQQWINYFENHE